ncbi:MAG TPA: hypothetical protein VGK21_09245, partial [Candidatus Angelobacter sp.]
IKKRKRDATLIFPWGSFIFCDLICIWLCCVCQIQMNRGSRDEWELFFLYRKSSSMKLVVRLSRAARRPGSRLSVLEHTSAKLAWIKIPKKFGMRKWEIRSEKMRSATL